MDKSIVFLQRVGPFIFVMLLFLWMFGALGFSKDRLYVHNQQVIVNDTLPQIDNYLHEVYNADINTLLALDNLISTGQLLQSTIGQ